MKLTKRCKYPECNSEFKPFKSTDKYCSWDCFVNDTKDKPKFKKTYKIKPYSEKRQRESRLYTKKRKTFLSKLENQFCPVCEEVFNEQRKTTEVHHIYGRKGKLLNYVPFWLAVSRKGHNWIHNNPQEAYKLGFLGKASTLK